LKTGHTNEAGYSLAASAVQDGQRIVFVVNGLESAQARRIETEQMVRWAYSTFHPVRFFGEGAVAGTAEVWMGAAPTVPLVAPRDIAMLVPHDARGEVTAAVSYRGPIEAPVTAGQVIADLVVQVPGQADVRFPLAAGADVARGGLMRRIEAAAWLARDRAVGLVVGHD
jgi:serine-type D-Ala-D-Ala carboxypeptidase (penicillin-binding protein 5/6)